MRNGSMVIGVKVGSSLLTDDKGVNREYILGLCRQIADLKHLGHRVFLVTSGAVASEPVEYFSKNLRAAIGQVSLMGEYREFLGIFGIVAAQILVTDEDIGRPSDNPVALKTIQEALESDPCFQRIIPIINANDVVNSRELNKLFVCADNDRLSQLICERLGDVDLMIIGMDEEGLKGGTTGTIMHQVSLKNSLDSLLIFAHRLHNECSEKGFGNEGMKTKIAVAYHLMEAGIKVVLAPGREKDFILRAVAGEENFGTTFLPG